MMTLFGKQNYFVLWLLIVNLQNILLIDAESLEPPSYLFQPKEELHEGDGLSESNKNSFTRYLVSPYLEEDVEDPHYTKYGIDSDTELSFFRPLKRLGSEFLGKRSISSSVEAGNGKRRLGSEFLGKKRRLGSEFLGKRSEPLKSNGWDESEFLHTDFPFYSSMNYAGDRIPEMDKLFEEREKPKLEFKRALGSEFLGKRDVTSQQEQDASTSMDNLRTLHLQLLQQKQRMGSEFLGKRKMGSEFLGKRKMGSEFLGKRKMGSEFLGNRKMGSEFLGKRKMGSEFLGKRKMGSEFLGKRRMGSEFLGKRRMGSEFLGKRRMGSEFLGKRRMGSEFLGKRRMGSEFLGKRKMGSEFLGKRRMGSEFLGKRGMDLEFLENIDGSPEIAKLTMQNTVSSSTPQNEI